MTVYTADPVTLKTDTGAQAFELADTINRPRYVNRPIVLDFIYTPVYPEVVSIGLDTVTLEAISITDTVTFTAEVTLPLHRKVVNYEWKFGDGTVVQTSSSTIDHKYEVAIGPGVRASLIITDDLGNSYSCGHQLYITVPVDAPINGFDFLGESTESHHDGALPDRPSGPLLIVGEIIEAYTPPRAPDLPLGALLLTGETMESFTPGTPTDRPSAPLLVTGEVSESHSPPILPDTPSGALLITGEIS